MWLVTGWPLFLALTPVQPALLPGSPGATLHRKDSAFAQGVPARLLDNVEKLNYRNPAL